MTTPTVRRLAAALLAAFMASACTSAGAGEPSTASGSAAPDPGSAAILIAGSSTVEPISTGVAEALKATNPDFAYTITGEGTGDGFQRFCAGETDISDASRPIRADGEADVCAEHGVEYVELKVAIDGISILTAARNDGPACLSFADMYSLVGPESIGFRRWSDGQAIAADLGSSTTLPDADLSIFGPGEESGTFDSFVELVLTDPAEGRGMPEDEITTRPDYTASANDNAIIEGLGGSPTSFGWVGFAFYEEHLDVVRAFSVAEDPDGMCVEPTAETIADGSYPIARDLYLYVNTARAAANPAVEAYIDFYLADGTIASVLETVPYVNLTPDALAETRATWDGR